MNEFVQHSKRLNIKNEKIKREILKIFQNSMILKDYITIGVIFLSVHLKKIQKK